MRKLFLLIVFLAISLSAQQEMQDSIKYTASGTADSVAIITLPLDQYGEPYLYHVVTLEDSGSTAALGGIGDSSSIHVYDRLLDTYVQVAGINLQTGVKELYLAPGSGATKSWLVYHMSARVLKVAIENYRGAYTARRIKFSIRSSNANPY